MTRSPLLFIATAACCALISFAGCSDKTNPVRPTPEVRIDSVSPIAGYRTTRVVIYGKGFIADTSKLNLLFSAQQGTFVQADIDSVSMTLDRIYTVVPLAANTGPLRLVISNTTTVASSRPFVVIDGDPPRVIDMQPRSGSVGARVRITGSNFDPRPDSIRVVFGNVPAMIDSASSTDIMLRVPSGALACAPVLITRGIVVPLPDFVVSPLAIHTIQPVQGIPGTAVVLTTSFVPDSHVAARLGSEELTTIYSTDSSISYRIPAGAGSGNIVVSAYGALASSPAFTVVPPAITSCSPQTGPPGTVVLLNTNFSLDSTSTARIASMPLPILGRSDTTLTIRIPSGASSGPIAVTYRYGTGITAMPFTVTARTHRVTGFNPTWGHPGQKVAIAGTQFGTDTSGLIVTFGNVPAQVISVRDTQIIAVVPTTKLTAPISVGIFGDVATSSNDFQICVGAFPFMTCTISAGNYFAHHELWDFVPGHIVDTAKVSYRLAYSVTNISPQPAPEYQIFSDGTRQPADWENYRWSFITAQIDTSTMVLHSITERSASHFYQNRCTGGGGDSVAAENIPITANADGSWTAIIRGSAVSTALRILWTSVDSQYGSGCQYTYSETYDGIVRTTDSSYIRVDFR